MSNSEQHAKLGRQGPEREIRALHPRCHLVQLCVWTTGSMERIPSLTMLKWHWQYPPLWIAGQIFRKSTDRLCIG
jgi:hypothetical protein